MKPRFPLLIATIFFLSKTITSINIRNAKLDPVFKYKQNNPRNLSVQHTRLQNSNLNNQSNPPAPQKRELLLDYFGNNNANKANANITGKDTPDMTRLVEMLKLAQSFQGDPNYDVKLSINFANASNSGRLLEEVKESSKSSKINLMP